MTQSRRHVLHRIAAAVGALLLTPRTGLTATATPPGTEGPFYPSPAMRPADVDNDLVRVAGAVRAAGGEVVRLSGRVLDARGRPLPGLRVEIWQCDATGIYLHSRDRRRGAYDTAFQGFGHDITDGDGRYLFRTIKPVPYPGRTPHIHVKVLDSRGREMLTTQFYLQDHPQNARDGLFRRMSAAQQAAVLMEFSGGAEPEAQVDIVLA